jgi:DNA (cytosine-5)-methyltransferase 1
VPVAFGGNRTSGSIEITPALLAHQGSGWKGDYETETFIVQPVAFDTTQMTSAANRSNPKPGDPCHPLAAGAHPPAIAFHPTQDPISSTDGTTHAMGCGSSGGTASIAVAFQPGNLKRGCGSPPNTDVFPTLAASHGRGQSDQDPHVLTAMQVRRLTPTECERLQGFPDGYTAIPWRKKPASECPDGPRYKALGNSWATPNVQWIGRRINSVDQITKEAAHGCRETA